MSITQRAEARPSGPLPTGGEVRISARVTLFGHDPVDCEVTLIPRSTRWRLLRTVRLAAVFAVVLPIAGLIPPHAPWLAGAVTAAVVLGRRRWTERFTIMAFNSPCPRCGHGLELGPGTRLRTPHPVSCDGCGHEPLMTADLPA